MEKMKTSRLFTKTLILIVILFGIIATATSVLSGWTLYRSLTAEYKSKGIAIAKSVADSSAEILLNRDLSTVQAIIDQFGKSAGLPMSSSPTPRGKSFRTPLSLRCLKKCFLS